MMSIRSDLTIREIFSAGKDTSAIPVSIDDRLVVAVVPKSEKKVGRLVFRAVLPM